MFTSDRNDVPFSRRTLLKVGAGTAGALGLVMTGAGNAFAHQQNEWRWCNRCQTLFFDGNETSGWCPQGGGHNHRGSGNYTPFYGEGSGENDWRWCSKCQGLWYAGFSGRGRCPSGEGHSEADSADYYIDFGSPHQNDQAGWRRCNKCYGLCYSGIDRGRCPAGGRHNFNRSKGYVLPHQ